MRYTDYTAYDPFAGASFFAATAIIVSAEPRRAQFQTVPAARQPGRAPAGGAESGCAKHGLQKFIGPVWVEK